MPAPDGREEVAMRRRRFQDAIAQIDAVADWTQRGMGRPIQGLRSAAPGMTQWTLRGMHVRLWHAPA